MPEQLNPQYFTGNIQRMELVLYTAAAFLLYFIYRSHVIGRQLEKFTRDFEAQLTGFLATHNHWSDVAHIALKTAPDTLEGLLRLFLTLQELTHQISRAGGIARLLADAAAKPPTPKEQDQTHHTKQRKPQVKRVSRSTPDEEARSISSPPLDLDQNQSNMEDYQ